MPIMFSSTVFDDKLSELLSLPVRHLFDSLIFCLENPQKTARPHQNRSDMLTSGSDELVICGTQTHLMLYNYAHINEELPKIYLN